MAYKHNTIQAEECSDIQGRLAIIRRPSGGNCEYGNSIIRAKQKYIKVDGEKDVPGPARRESDADKNIAGSPGRKSQKSKLGYRMQMKERNTMVLEDGEIRQKYVRNNSLFIASKSL